MVSHFGGQEAPSGRTRTMTAQRGCNTTKKSPFAPTPRRRQPRPGRWLGRLAEIFSEKYRAVGAAGGGGYHRRNHPRYPDEATISQSGGDASCVGGGGKDRQRTFAHCNKGAVPSVWGYVWRRWHPGQPRRAFPLQGKRHNIVRNLYKRHNSVRICVSPTLKDFRGPRRHGWWIWHESRSGWQLRTTERRGGKSRVHNLHGSDNVVEDELANVRGKASFFQYSI